MIKNVAHFISAILHPLLMSSILFAVIILFSPIVVSPISNQEKTYIMITVFLSTFLFPLVSLVLFKSTNMVSGFHLADRKERTIPFIFITIIYMFACYFFLEKLQVNMLFVVALMGVTGIIFCVTIITFFWKISAHGAAVGGCVGFLTGISFKYTESQLLLPLLTFVLLSGTVMSARLYLNAHTSEQVFGGWALGAIIGFFSIYLFL